MPKTKQNPEKSSRRRNRDRSPARKWIKGLELTGGILLCLLVAITPWLYATTERWSINLMNGGSYVAGLIFVAAAVVNRFSRSEGDLAPKRTDRIPRITFLTLNLLTLAFCGVAWWNARATFSIAAESFTYFDYYRWLPTTYDAILTREMWLMLLACFTAFWSIRYWLLRGWDHVLSSRSETSSTSALSNRRFSALLWVISLNGLLLAMQGILQRLSGSPKLLWMRTSYWADATSCFGPFSYRGSAVNYLNLIWPVALGFWWFLSRERRRLQRSSRLLTDGPEMMLLPAIVIIAAASFVTLSRGGAVIAAGLLVALLVVFGMQQGAPRATRIGVAVLLATVIGVVTYLGWGELIKRFKDDNLAGMSGRTEIYKNAKQMAADYPWFGVGPGSFRSVYHLYREDARQPRHGYLHNDWFETRVTFGWVGYSLVLAQLAVLAWWVLARGKAPAPGVFAVCFGLAFAGSLAHAKYDLPFQTYSILFTFCALAAILATVTPSRK
jgi:O-antigen ligase